MVTLGRAAWQDNNRFNEWYGKSTDVKPTDSVNNGDVFYEMDTKKVFMYDAETNSWIQQ